MSENENLGQAASQAGGEQPGQGSEHEAGTPPTQGDRNEPGPIPYTRFKEVNDQLRELREWKARQEAEAKKAEEERLAQEEKWRELAEKREQELNALRVEQLRTRIAMQKQIPADLIDRLKGETEEEIAADADRLLQYIKPPTGPGVPPASKGGQPSRLDITQMTPEEIRKNRDALMKQMQ